MLAKPSLVLTCSSIDSITPGWCIGWLRLVNPSSRSSAENSELPASITGTGKVPVGTFGCGTRSLSPVADPLFSCTTQNATRVAFRGVATGVDIGIYTPKISPSKLFMG